MNLPELAYDYVLSRFIFHAGSALYPLASYVALHWQIPSEDVQCIDLAEMPGTQGHDVALHDLGFTDSGEDASPHDANLPLIDIDIPE